MELINQNFRGLTPEEFDETIAGLNSLAFVCIQELAGEDEAAIQFVADLKLAKDAIRKIKQQVCGAGEPCGAVDFERFDFEHYDKVATNMAVLALFAVPGLAVDIGANAVVEYMLACMIASDAVDEVKHQVYGVGGEIDGPYKPGTGEGAPSEV